MFDLDYAVGWQLSTLSRDGEELVFDGESERTDQHGVALMCPACMRVYDAAGIRNYEGLPAEPLDHSC